MTAGSAATLLREEAWSRYTAPGHAAATRRSRVTETGGWESSKSTWAKLQKTVVKSRRRASFRTRAS
jgi:hypothetical protein